MLQNEKAKILRIKLSSGMDCLSREEREKAVSFGFALNAVGGRGIRAVRLRYRCMVFRLDFLSDRL